MDSKSSFGKLFTNITTKSGEFFFRTTPVTNEAEKTINSRENIDCTIPTELKSINLSQRDLNTGEIHLLEHGLKFTPTPKSDKVDVVTDTEEFCRKLRLKEFFQNENNNDISLVKNNKGFKPPLNRDKHLEDYISCLRNTANSNVTDKTVKSNISHKQYQAMQTLKNDPSIIIKNADKGGAIVIMDRDHYKEMSLSQLQDHQFYTKLEQNEDRRTMLKIEKLTRKYQDNLTDNEIEYLTKYEVKSSNFYGLPKIHKCKNIQENVRKCNATYIKLPRPNDLKLRPIIAGPASSTQRLSNMLDIILKPLCTKVTSYVRDDMDFLNYIPQTVPGDTILVTFDVSSLYTNIPHNLGL